MDNKIYKYEMHIHTSPCSGGGSDIRAHIDVLIAKGYSGMVVTNHFYCGDNRIDKSLPWKEFVSAYRNDYLYGLEYAKKLDFDLLFGLEEHVGNGQEILIYGITPDLIDKHPELIDGDVYKYIKIVHEHGGLIYQAHPFRNRVYVKSPVPLDCLHLLDGIEVYNAANEPAWNDEAQQFANKLGLACIGGSDGHDLPSAGRSGIATSVRLKDNATLISVLKSGNYTVIKQ